MPLRWNSLTDWMDGVLSVSVTTHPGTVSLTVIMVVDRARTTNNFKIVSGDMEGRSTCAFVRMHTVLGSRCNDDSSSRERGVVGNVEFIFGPHVHPLLRKQLASKTTS